MKPKHNPALRTLRLALLLAQMLYISSVAAKETPDATYLSITTYEKNTPAPITKRPAIGTGDYGYQFIVRDPLHTDKPYRNGRFSINLRSEDDAVTFPDGTTNMHLTTDAQGNTPLFRFKSPIKASIFEVMPIVGKGMKGETFRLVAEQSDFVLAGIYYLVNYELGGVYCGRSLPTGITARFTSVTPESLSIYASDNLSSSSYCIKVSRKINPVMARRTMQSQLAGLEQLIRNTSRKEKSLLELLNKKKEDLILAKGSLAQVKQVHLPLLNKAKKLGSPTKLDKESAHDMAGRFNQQGFDLLSKHPARHIAYAESLIDLSLQYERNLFNLDSKGWALYLKGQPEAALPWINESIEILEQDCNHHRNAYLESIGHRATVNWALKRRNEALTDWAQLSMDGTYNDWSNDIANYEQLRPLIRAKERVLKERQQPTSFCAKPSKVEQTPPSPSDDATEEDMPKAPPQVK